ncbi:MAG TPA: hypothetical protein VMY37_24580 [Thermoguttaceae bacterium]|nr:hypothetical protein [Thermoguttaceae bacterium]
MRKILLPALAVAVLLATSRVVPAQAAQPESTGLKTVLTVSVSGFDAIKKDVQTIAQASGMDQLMMPFMMLGPQGPAGIDTTKPWGAVVQTDGQKLRVFAFLPASDPKLMLGFLKPLGEENASPEPDADGVYEIEVRGWELVLAKKGDWVVLADDRQTLANVPADPVPLLGGLNKSYAFAVRGSIKDIPASNRDQVVGLIRSGVEMAQQAQPDKAPGEQTIARSMEEVDKLLNEIDSVLIGLAVEPQSKAIRLDVEMTAIEGTSTAAEYALAAEAKSDLAGFYLPEAALSALFAGTMPESDSAQLLEWIDARNSEAMKDLDEQDLSDGEKKLAKQMLGDLISVLRKTVAAGRIDVGLSVLAGADSLSLVGGGSVADAATLEKLLKQTVHLAIAEDPGVEQAVTLDAEEHQGVRLHTLSVPAEQLPTDDIPAMIVGDVLTAAVGFSDQHAYLAVGPKAIDKLKQAIDQSKAAAGQSLPPARVSLSLTAIGNILGGLGAATDLDVPTEVLDALAQAGPNDHLLISSEAIPNGVRTRIELQPGVLKAIGTAAAAMSPFGAGPGGFPAPGGLPGQP